MFRMGVVVWIQKLDLFDLGSCLVCNIKVYCLVSKSE
jgi:hypothetical protein